MQLIALIDLVMMTQLAASMGSYNEWKPPGPDDLRGPCPMLNTLANHGFLPRDGRGFTREVTVAAFENALNWDPVLGLGVWRHGLRTNTTANATQFDLSQISVHNFIEKDASLTRPDAALGDPILFNQTVFDSTRKWWKGRYIDLDMLTASKVARMLESRRDNPEYFFNNAFDEASDGEITAILAVFAQRGSLTIDRELLEFWLPNERLPTHLGWNTPPRFTKEIRDKIHGMVAQSAKIHTVVGNDTSSNALPPMGA